jgi:hypothetical protein
MVKNDIFQILILIARPAAGKSEVIDYLKSTQARERKNRFHVGAMDEIDDFPMLWTWFEEDALLEKMGKPRLHTDAEGYFLGNHLWDLLIERICLEYQKRQREPAREGVTTLIEFSRGSEHGGYQSAFTHLSQEVLEWAALMYIDVSWEESLRKNRKRFNPEKPDSILEHSLPDAKLERLYKETDWGEVSRGDGEFLHIGEYRVPCVVFDNADDVTTRGGVELGARLEACLGRLWEISTRKSSQGITRSYPV